MNVEVFRSQSKYFRKVCCTVYFSISKAAKKGTVQFVEWKFPKQYNKLEGLVMLYGILCKYFIPTWNEPKV